jgi:hypothetical protein
LRNSAFEAEGWMLNVSRGGARLVLDGAVDLGAMYQLEMGDVRAVRDVRIIWIQDEADGQIVGVQFLDADGSVPPPPAASDSGGS